jgi:hypothetical protein
VVLYILILTFLDRQEDEILNHMVESVLQINVLQMSS